MPEWQDSAIILGARAHGETGAVVQLLTRAQGRHAGLLPGGQSRAKQAFLQPGQQVTQSSEMGFIKFGSRVDLLLPLDAKVQVKIGDTPQGGVTVVATW